MRPGRLARVRDWLNAAAVDSVDSAVFQRLQTEMSDIPEAALRKLLRECEVPLAPLVEGVRQDTFESLARTLIGLQHEYEGADAGTRRHIRALVITAKDHARLASRRKPEKAAMVEWMLVWLENPPVFETWYRLKATLPGV